jgi:hypothetical protein
MEWLTPSLLVPATLVPIVLPWGLAGCRYHGRPPSHEVIPPTVHATPKGLDRAFARAQGGQIVASHPDATGLRLQRLPPLTV